MPETFKVFLHDPRKRYHAGRADGAELSCDLALKRQVSFGFNDTEPDALLHPRSQQAAADVRPAMRPGD